MGRQATGTQKPATSSPRATFPENLYMKTYV
jgi:hypothetical protein